MQNHSAIAPKPDREAPESLGRITLLLVILALLTWVWNLSSVKRLSALDRAHVARGAADISTIGIALMTYGDFNKRYPTTAEGLEELTKPQRYGGTHMESVPLDPWGQPYHYESPGKHHPHGYDLWTDGGPNRFEVNNWEDEAVPQPQKALEELRSSVRRIAP